MDILLGPTKWSKTSLASSFSLEGGKSWEKTVCLTFLVPKLVTVFLNIGLDLKVAIYPIKTTISCERNTLYFDTSIQ